MFVMMRYRSAHYCRLRHAQRCVRAADLASVASPLAYLGTAGRLGNAMSTLAILLALRARGFTPLIDLANYQVRDGCGDTKNTFRLQ